MLEHAFSVFPIAAGSGRAQPVFRRHGPPRGPCRQPTGEVRGPKAENSALFIDLVPRLVARGPPGQRVGKCRQVVSDVGITKTGQFPRGTARAAIWICGSEPASNEARAESVRRSVWSFRLRTPANPAIASGATVVGPFHQSRRPAAVRRLRERRLAESANSLQPQGGRRRRQEPR